MPDISLQNTHSNKAGYQQLIDLYTHIRTTIFDTIDVSIGTWFDANLAAALGGVLDLAERELNTVRIDHIQEAIKAILQKNGFLAHYGYPSLPDGNRTTIQYKKLKKTDSRYFNQYVMNDLLDRSELPIITQNLKKRIAESIYEIFVNAQIHSQTHFIYTCGQFFPLKNQICFSICDTGIGFKETVSRRFNREITAEQAILWATKQGNTTKRDVPGGIGLAILREFIAKNQGELHIVSNGGYYYLDSRLENTSRFTGDFPGTIVTMKFNTNDRTMYDIVDPESVDDLF